MSDKAKQEIELNVDWLTDECDPPITIEKSHSKSTEYQTNGWKYYLLLKPRLSRWWKEFTEEFKSNGSPKHKDVWGFIQSKTKKAIERDMLWEMLGPKEAGLETYGEKRRIPWLGDWDKHRKNGYWAEDTNSVRAVAKLIKSNVDSAQAIKAAAPFIVKEISRYNRLHDKIDESFGGSPFLPNESPDSKRNQARHRMYVKMHEAASEMVYKAISQWMRIHGIDPNSPHQMWDMTTLAQMSGQIGASAALTGATAAGGLRLPSASGSPDLVINETAMKVAYFLQQQAESFNMPLPQLTLDGDQIIEAKETPKEKANGKHRTQ